MTPAKTGAQRQAERKARLKAKGLKAVHNLWATRENAVLIQEYADMLSGESDYRDDMTYLPGSFKDYLMHGGKCPDGFSTGDGKLQIEYDLVSVFAGKGDTSVEFRKNGVLVYKYAVKHGGSGFCEISSNGVLAVGISVA